METGALLGLVLLVPVLLMRADVRAFVFAGSVISIAGLSSLASTGEISSSRVVWFATAAMAMQLGLSTRIRSSDAPIARRKNAETQRRLESHDARPDSLVPVVWIVGALAIYHLMKGGLPFLGTNVEVSRFDFTSSGLFGIPGRMFLYGVPITWSLATASAFSRPSGRLLDQRSWRIATAFLIATSLLGGFKSGVVSLLTTCILVVSTVSEGWHYRVVTLLRRYWIAVVLALGYAMLVALKFYPTYRDSNESIGVLILDRIFVDGIQPKALALSGELAPQRENILADLRYFLLKYTGNPTPGMYPAERQISAAIIGVDPASDAWTTPVTVGGVAELIFFLGPVWAALVAFFLGLLTRAICSKRSESWVTRGVGAVWVLMINSWVSRGGLVYYALNYAVVLVFVLLMVWTSRRILPRPVMQVSAIDERQGSAAAREVPCILPS